jgi:indoleamine 2,3-dioxygenase
MIWEIDKRGFLTVSDPITNLTTKNEKYIPLIEKLENIATILPFWIKDCVLREELVFSLKQLDDLFDEQFLQSLDDANDERIMHLYSFMASAYVYCDKEAIATKIPAEIAIPLYAISRKLDRKPILSHASYCLMNWNRIDFEEPIEFDNLKVLTNFSVDAKKQEDAFICTLVDMENAAAEGVFACKILSQNPWSKSESFNVVTADDILTKIYVSLAKMNKVFARLPEKCSVEDYFSRHSMFSFCEVTFEGCDIEPVTISGEVFSQSSILQAFLMALGISCLEKEKESIRKHMPVSHRDFLRNLMIQTTNSSVDSIALRSISKNNVTLKEIYNECLLQIISFCDKKLRYVKNWSSSPSFLIKEIEEQFI